MSRKHSRVANENPRKSTRKRGVNGFQIVLFTAITSLVAYSFNPKGDLWISFALGVAAAFIGFLIQSGRRVGGNKLTIGLTMVTLAAVGIAYYRYQEVNNICYGVVTEPNNKPADIANHELLVLVSDFNVSNDIQPLAPGAADDLFIALERRAETLQSTDFNIQVEHLLQPEILDPEEARQVGDCLNATVTIWGDVRQTDVRYEYILTPRWAVEEVNKPQGYQSLITSKNQPEQFAIEGGGGGEAVLDYIISILYYSDNKTDQALYYLNQAISFANSYPQIPSSLLREIYYVEGLIYISFGGPDNIDRSIDAFGMAIKVDPNYEFAYTNRGVAYAERDRTYEAMSDFNKAIELDPNDTFALRDRGHLHEVLSEYPEAMSDFNKAIELDPSDANSYYERGMLNLALGNGPAAKSDLEKAQKLGINGVTISVTP